MDVQPYRSAAAVKPNDSTEFPESRAIGVRATSAGDVSIKLAGGDDLVVPVSIGFEIFPLAAIGVNRKGTTAEASFFRLN